MQPVYLAHHAYASATDDLLVILNGLSGAYYGVPLDAASSLFPCLGGGVHDRHCADPADRKALYASLSTMGLITTDRASGKRIAPLQVTPTGDLNSHTLAPQHDIGITEAFLFLRSALLASISLKLRSFTDLAISLEAIKNGSKPRLTDARPKLPSLLASFRTLRALTYTSSGNCLYDSLVLERFLLAHRIPSTLIVAVGTRPFGAHCWVQYDGLVLNDSASHVREFTPLVAI